MKSSGSFKNMPSKIVSGEVMGNFHFPTADRSIIWMRWCGGTGIFLALSLANCVRAIVGNNSTGDSGRCYALHRIKDMTCGAELADRAGESLGTPVDFPNHLLTEENSRAGVLPGAFPNLACQCASRHQPWVWQPRFPPHNRRPELLRCGAGMIAS